MAATLALCACIGRVPPRVRAAEVEQRECTEGDAARQQEQALRATTVVDVASKCHIATCSGAGQVFGVRLWMRPPSGVSAGDLAAMLRCHGARALLGRAESPLAVDDPYSLPDAWVGIEVKPVQDAFLVTLNGESVSDNLRLLHRAAAFAAAQHAAKSTP
jgi:hypothetical protein